MAILSENMVFSKTRTQDLRNVKQLNCWGSELVDVSLVRQMPFVQVLSLSVNSIKSLADFSYCKNLQELYLRDNKVSDLTQLMHLQDLQNLKKLWLSGNPCSDVPNYRMIVLRILPNLDMLDNIPVSRDEVIMAENIQFEIDEETGEITQIHDPSAPSHARKQSSVASDRDYADDEYSEEGAAEVPHRGSAAHHQAVPPNRQYSTPEPLPSGASSSSAAVNPSNSQRVPNQRFSYETDARLRQPPPAHLVTPVQTHSNNNTPVCGSNNNMVRSASIADYTAYSGDSFTQQSNGSKSAIRLLPKGGRNRVCFSMIHPSCLTFIRYRSVSNARIIASFPELLVCE